MLLLLNIVRRRVASKSLCYTLRISISSTGFASWMPLFILLCVTQVLLFDAFYCVIGVCTMHEIVHLHASPQVEVMTLK